MVSRLSKSFITKSKLVHSETYGYDKAIYRTMKSKVEIFCKKHNAYFWQSADSHLSGSGCPDCAKLKRKSIQSADQFIKRIISKHGSEYDYSLVNFKGVKNKIEIICSKHGSFWQIAKAHLNGSGCPKCAKLKRTLTICEFIEAANRIHNNTYCYDDAVYVNAVTKLKIKCRKHNTIFWQTPSSHYSGSGCPICAQQLNGDDLDSFMSKSFDVHGSKYNYSKVDYVESHIRVEIICSKHGSFWQLPSVHVRGSGCPRCCHRISQFETDVFEFIQSIIPDTKIIRSDRSILKGKELDIYIPDKALAIECNGTYWHSEQQGKDKTYHLSKTKLCLDQNIILMHIFEHDWKYKQSMMKSLITRNLGSQRIINSNECEARELSRVEADAYFRATSIHWDSIGCCDCFNYGLVLNGEIVCAMSFAKLGSCWVIVGMCCLLNGDVTSGYDTVFSHFQKMHRSPVVGYSDISCYSMFDDLATLGFSLISTTIPQRSSVGACGIWDCGKYIYYFQPN